MQLLFPTADLIRPFSMLGLGDIVIPGRMTLLMYWCLSFVKFTCNNTLLLLVVYISGHPKNKLISAHPKNKLLKLMSRDDAIWCPHILKFKGFVLVVVASRCSGCIGSRAFFQKIEMIVMHLLAADWFSHAHTHLFTTATFQAIAESWPCLYKDGQY